MSEELLQQVMGIIAHAGEGKSLAMEALASCRAANYDEADALLSQSGKAIADAHEIHRQILAHSASHEQMPVSFLLVHAADYLTAAGTCRDLAEELVFMYREVRHV